MAFHIGWNKEKRAAATNVEQYFQMMTGYQPRFQSLAGGIFEMDLTRACVVTNAKHRAKLKPVITGAARPDLKRILEFRPNPIQSTYDFLYRLSTIYDCENNAYILPIVDPLSNKIVQIFSAPSSQTKILDKNGTMWADCTFGSKRVTIEYEKIGHMRNHYYKDDFFGESNKPIDGTLRLIDAQRQVIENGAASSGFFRFMASLAVAAKDQTLKEARDYFAKSQFEDNNSGMILFDSRFKDVKQIDSKPALINPQQMAEIRTNAFEYFGTNDKILTSSFTEEEWNAYYEGTVEPWALQASMEMMNMLFSLRELSTDNRVTLEANRLEYASNTTKIAIVTQMFDRGLFTINEGLEVFNKAPIPDGDKRYIRKEYAEINKLDDVSDAEAEPEQVVQTPLPAEKPDEPKEDNNAES